MATEAELEQETQSLAEQLGAILEGHSAHAALNALATVEVQAFTWVGMATGWEQAKTLYEEKCKRVLEEAIRLLKEQRNKALPGVA